MKTDRNKDQNTATGQELQAHGMRNNYENTKE